MKLILLIILIFVTRLSYANDYTSEVVCTISQNEIIIKTIKHDLWRDYSKKDTWKFDLNFSMGNYQAAFKLDIRNAYIEIKNLDTGLVSSNVSDFIITDYAPIIATKLDDIIFYCKGTNELNSEEWKSILAFQFDLPIEDMRSALDTITDLLKLKPTNENDEKIINQSSCYLIGDLSQKHRMLNQFSMKFLLNRKTQFPGVYDIYLNDILHPTNHLMEFCLNKMKKEELEVEVNNILESLTIFQNEIHAGPTNTLFLSL